MIIGVDIDGVLNDLHTPWLKLYNEMAEDNLQLEDIKSYDLEKYVKPGYARKIYSLLDTPGLFRNASLMKDAQKGIQHLIDKGHTVLIISAFYPSPIACVEKTAWLQEHFPMLDLRNCLIYTKAKHYVKMDMLIDDCQDNLYKLTPPNEYGGTRGILFSKPYNIDVNCDGNVLIRMNSWEELIENAI